MDGIPVSSSIPGSIADGTPAGAAAEPELPALPDFKVLSTVTRRIFVEEPPELPGLPPVAGMITATVQVVEDPHLPDPPPVVVAGAGADGQSGMPVGQEEEERTLMVSATVYGHSLTCLRWGELGNGPSETVAWSNLDFNHFGGFSSYQVKGGDGVTRHYSLMMAIGNESPEDAPEHPALANDGPGFVVTERDAGDLKSLQTIGDMHDLYRTEGARMAAAYVARNAAEEERRAWLLAHPPVPEDVTVQFWKREEPPGPQTRNENGEDAR